MGKRAQTLWLRRLSKWTQSLTTRLWPSIAAQMIQIHLSGALGINDLIPGMNLAVMEDTEKTIVTKDQPPAKIRMMEIPEGTVLVEPIPLVQSKSRRDEVKRAEAVLAMMMTVQVEGTRMTVTQSLHRVLGERSCHLQTVPKTAAAAAAAAAAATAVTVAAAAAEAEAVRSFSRSYWQQFLIFKVIRPDAILHAKLDADSSQ